MKSSLFPDVNVWLALTHDRHVHHATAAAWFRSESDAPVCFCRFTQMGLLRLLTNESVMGIDVMTQRKAWGVYQDWFDDDRIEFLREPESVRFEEVFRTLSLGQQPSTKLWADAYLVPFARTAGLTLVTFDRAFRRLGPSNATVLEPAV